MPVVQDYISLDDLYARTERKLDLNDINISQSNIKELIYTTYGDEISLIPQCECGYFKGGYLIGKECPQCHTTVVKTFDNIKPILWIRKFDEDLPWIDPGFWADLSRIISVKVDGLRWLSDTSYNPPTIPPVLRTIKDMIGGRSYKNVLNNLETIIKLLMHNSHFKTLNKQIKLKMLHENYLEAKDKILSDRLPLINKKLFVMENTSKGDYTLTLLADVIDVALLAVTTANDVTITNKRLQNNVAKIISASASLFTNYVKELVSGKGGLSRKNIYGTRAHFTFRGVVTSLSTGYTHDEIHAPWLVLCTTFRPHVYNKLLKRGYTPKQANAKIFAAVQRYDKDIADIGKEITKESEYRGIPTLANRNPSLGMNSIQLVYITEFKKNVNDNTIGISLHIATAFNMDIDGDGSYTLVNRTK